MTRGTITKRGKNSWQLKYDLPRDHGIRRQRYATVTGTCQDAQRELTRLLGAVDAGTHVDPSQMTLAEYLQAFFAMPAKVSPKTLERYRELAERQIIPHLGALKLQKLRPEHIPAMARHAAPDRAGSAHCRPRPSPPGPRAGICRRERHPCPQRGGDSQAAQGRERSRSRFSPPIRSRRFAPSSPSTPWCQLSSLPSPPACGAVSFAAFNGVMWISTGTRFASRDPSKRPEPVSG